MKKIVLSTLLILAAVSVYVKATAGSNDAKNKLLVSHTNTMKISKEKLIADPVLSLPEEFAKYKITGFDVSYVPKGSNNAIGPYTIKGDRFDGRMGTILANAKSGDRLFFDEIKTTSSTGSDAQITGMAAAVIIAE